MAVHTDAAVPLDPEKGACICRVCLACPERFTLRYDRETFLTIKCSLKNLRTLKPYRLLITEEEMYNLRKDAQKAVSEKIKAWKESLCLREAKR